MFCVDNNKCCSIKSYLKGSFSLKERIVLLLALGVSSALGCIGGMGGGGGACCAPSSRSCAPSIPPCSSSRYQLTTIIFLIFVTKYEAVPND